MKTLEEIIASENIEGAFQSWKEYRNEITDYIKGRVSLCDNLPVIAIWGAGEANDIDLKKMSKTGRLVLIDRDQKALKKAITKYKLESEEIVCSNIGFWDIEDKDYENILELLTEGIEYEIVLKELENIVLKNNWDIKNVRNNIFDYSVCIGVHSQLNARLAAMIFDNKDNYEPEEVDGMLNFIRGLNKVAVQRLDDFIYYTTKKEIIYGYEITANVTPILEKEIKNNAGEQNLTKLLTASQIEGAIQLEENLSIHNEFDLDILDDFYTIWPFIEKDNKKYVMRLLTISKKD